jgi:hypothetical protein
LPEEVVILTAYITKKNTQVRNKHLEAGEAWEAGSNTYPLYHHQNTQVRNKPLETWEAGSNTYTLYYHQKHPG